VNTTGWLKGLQVTADGTGIVSHAGVALVRALGDKTGLTAGLSKALASRRLLVHDRGRVLADLACAIADGAEVISDFRVIGDQDELFGLVASVPTAWRTLDEIACGGDRALGRITAAVNAARRRAWAGIEARHGALPGIRVADKMLDGVTCIRLDASVVTCHSDKEGAEPNFKGFTRCWPTATTRASRWPGCCGPARPGATPPPITWRCWTPRSRRCRRPSGGG
jgi:Transposase DDE domain group 1